MYKRKKKTITRGCIVPGVTFLLVNSKRLFLYLSMCYPPSSRCCFRSKVAQPPTHIRQHGETVSCNVLYQIGAAGQKEHVCKHSGVCRWGSGTSVNHRNGGQECIKGTRELLTHGSRRAEWDQIQRSSQLEENARLWKLIYAKAWSTEK